MDTMVLPCLAIPVHSWQGQTAFHIKRLAEGVCKQELRTVSDLEMKMAVSIINGELRRNVFQGLRERISLAHSV